MSSEHAVKLLPIEEGTWLGSAIESLEAVQRMYNQMNLHINATMPVQHSCQVL